MIKLPKLHFIFFILDPSSLIVQNWSLHAPWHCHKCDNTNIKVKRKSREKWPRDRRKKIRHILYKKLRNNVYMQALLVNKNLVDFKKSFNYELEKFQFRWLNIKGFDTAFPILVGRMGENGITGPVFWPFQVVRLFKRFILKCLRMRFCSN